MRIIKYDREANLITLELDAELFTEILEHTYHNNIDMVKVGILNNLEIGKEVLIKLLSEDNGAKKDARKTT